MAITSAPSLGDARKQVQKPRAHIAGNCVACRRRYLESGRHTRWRRLTATDEVAHSLVFAALPRRHLTVAQLSHGTIGSGGGLFDCCGVVVCVGPQHSTGARCCTAFAAVELQSSQSCSFAAERRVLICEGGTETWGRQRQWVFVADMSTAETPEPGILLGVELLGGEAAVGFLPQSTDFDGECVLSGCACCFGIFSG